MVLMFRFFVFLKIQWQKYLMDLPLMARARSKKVFTRLTLSNKTIMKNSLMIEH